MDPRRQLPLRSYDINLQKTEQAYNALGRVTDVWLPKTSTVYNTLDQAVKATDSRGTSILSAYDELGRATGTWDGTKDDAHQLTGFTYDSVLKGQPTSSTRYIGGTTGQAYTTSVTKYDSLSRPVANELTLPAGDPFVEAGEPSTLNYTRYYNIDNSLQQSKEPALGGLPSEIVANTYDELGDVTAVGGATGYLRDVDYSALAQPQLLTLGTGGSGAKNLYIADTYEEGTGRLTRSSVTDQTHPYMLQDLNYTHDQTGNVTAISDPTAWGWLALRAAAAAGRNNRPQEARHYHRMANTAAAAVGREHTGSFFRHWTTFGPLTVGMKDVEDAMILGDARTVVRKSSQDAMSPKAWKNTGRPSDDNWNRHRMDVSRAHARTGDLTAAMDELAAVRRASPQWLRHQRMAAETMQEILKKRKRTLTAEMREMTAYLGVVG